MKERDVIFAAKIVSALFNPFYLPVIGLILLFIFSYLNLLPWAYKLQVITLVYMCTVLLPTFLIHLYRRYQGWSLIELGVKERRMVPYVIAIVCYGFCYYLMQFLRIPHFMASIVMAALIIQVVCGFINQYWKISTHTAAIGGVTGALLAFSFAFSYNPVWWLCIAILLAGVLGTARMILRQHTLAQVVVGFIVGYFCAYYSILWI